MQLSGKPKIFCSFFYRIFEIYIKFATFSKKKKEKEEKGLHSLSISEIIDSE